MDDHDSESLKPILVAGIMYAPVLVFLAWVAVALLPAPYHLVAIILLGVAPPVVTTLNDGGILAGWLAVAPVVVLVVVGYAIAMDIHAPGPSVRPSLLIGSFLSISGAIVGFGTVGYGIGAGLRWILDDRNQQ